MTGFARKFRFILRLLGIILMIYVSQNEALADLSFETIEEDGILVILVTGEFETSDDVTQIRNAIGPSSAKLFTFNSLGGNPYKAMELGRQIRSLGLTTIQLRSGRCDSACALAFMGGRIRVSEPGSIGVHQSSFTAGYTGDQNTAASDIQAVTGDIISYFIEMGIDPSLLAIVLQYESSDIRHLSGSEMAKYNVTTSGINEAEVETEIRTDRNPESQTFSPRDVRAISGQVRHPNGRIELRNKPHADSAKVAILANQTNVRIIGDIDHWYKLETDNVVGFAHHSWIKIDQYVHNEFSSRYIQIRSFSEEGNAMQYAKSSLLPVSVFLASNGWYAVTLNHTYAESVARDKLAKLKTFGNIPGDSFITYGNTYKIQICCE